MYSNNVIGNRQTKPKVIFVTSGFFTAVKTIKYFYLFFIADSYTCIRNFYFKVFILIGNRQIDNTAFWSVADGIVKEDCEHLYNAITVTYTIWKWIFGERSADF